MGSSLHLLPRSEKNEVKKLVLYYPALSIPDDARKGSMLGAEFSGEEIPDSFKVTER